MFKCKDCGCMWKDDYIKACPVCGVVPDSDYIVKEKKEKLIESLNKIRNKPEKLKVGKTFKKDLENIYSGR